MTVKVPVSVHERNLRQLRCVVSGSDQQIELHHCHGGSMRGIVSPGVALKANPFFQIPLSHRYHTGEFNPEAMGTDRWESAFGEQLDLLRVVNQQLEYNIFFQAGLYDEDELRYYYLNHEA